MKFLVSFYNGGDGEDFHEIVDAESAQEAVDIVENDEGQQNSVRLVVLLCGALRFRPLDARDGASCIFIAAEGDVQGMREAHYSLEEFMDEAEDVPEYRA